MDIKYKGLNGLLFAWKMWNVFHLRKESFIILYPNTARGRIETPPKANLSALSFRLHKKGRACRGMSDELNLMLPVDKSIPYN